MGSALAANWPGAANDLELVAAGADAPRSPWPLTGGSSHGVEVTEVTGAPPRPGVDNAESSSVGAMGPTRTNYGSDLGIRTDGSAVTGE